MGNIIPYRGLASGGVITDVNPFNLPLGAWSWGVNVRFRNNTVSRGPVFRTAKSGLLNSAPRFLGANVPSTGFDTLILGYLNGRVTGLVNGTETDLSISGFTNNSADSCFTACHINDVYYINRTDRAPWSLVPTGTIFTTLPNWAPVSAPWTCNILRACNNALIALGVTQNGVSNPTMVITSEFQAGASPPSSWDYTIGTNNATSNFLGEMEGPITEAQTLGNELIIYGIRETWRMFLTGDQDIWGVLPLFSDAGAINANCALEIDKKHFVFGADDIWMHDGNSKISIIDQKNREFLFAGLDFTNASRCGVAYNKNLKEIYFRYMSSDAFTTAGGFPKVDGCNRQATFHIPTGTWSFDDLPYVFGAVMGNVDVTLTWDADTRTWDTAGGSWAANDDSIKKVMVMVGDTNSAASLSESVYAFDLQGPGSLVTFAVDTNATKGWKLIRDGIDLHELRKDLRGYLQISSIYPQMILEPGAEPVSFTFGTSDYYGQPTQIAGTQTYDGNTEYKLDFNVGGRYASLTIEHDDYRHIELTGIDFDIDVLGEF